MQYARSAPPLYWCIATVQWGYCASGRQKWHRITGACLEERAGNGHCRHYRAGCLVLPITLPPDEGCRDVNHRFPSVVAAPVSTSQTLSGMEPDQPGSRRSRVLVHDTTQVAVGYPVPRHLGATLPCKPCQPCKACGVPYLVEIVDGSQLREVGDPLKEIIFGAPRLALAVTSLSLGLCLLLGSRRRFGCFGC